MSWSRTFFILGMVTVGTATHLSAIAPHPSLLMLRVDNERHVVVRMKGENPVWHDGDQEVRHRETPAYDVIRGKGYAQGFINISRMKGSQITGNGILGGFSMTLEADRDLCGNFIAMVVYNADYLTTGGWANTMYVVRKLPNLPAGRRVRVDIVTHADMMGWLSASSERLFFPIIFTEGGQEVKTNKWEAVAAYFFRTYQSIHAFTRSRYIERFSHQDHQITPYHTPAPVLPDDVEKPNQPVKVRLAVDEHGYVTAVSLKTTLDETIGQALTETLQEWLFMPRLKNGGPVATQVEVPVIF